MIWKRKVFFYDFSSIPSMYTDRRGRFSLSSAKILMSLSGQDFGRVSNNFNTKVAQECTWIRSTISCSLRKCWKPNKTLNFHYRLEEWFKVKIVKLWVWISHRFFSPIWKKNKAKWFAKQLASESLHGKHPRHRTTLTKYQRDNFPLKRPPQNVWPFKNFLSPRKYYAEWARYYFPH